MRSFTSSRPVWSASRISRASPTSSVLVGARAPRDLEHGVEPGADPPVLGALLARALEPVDLARRPRRARRRAARSSPRLGCGTPRPRRRRRRVSPSSLRIACELLAQQELALRLLHALGDAAADLLATPRARRASRAPSASAFSRRASGSSVSSSSTLRSTDRSGDQPAVSASAPGSSTPCERVGDARVSRAARRCRARSRGTRAPAHVARPGLGRGLGHGLGLDPDAGVLAGRRCVPTTARDRPRSTRARWPPGRSPSFSIRAIGADAGEPAADPRARGGPAGRRRWRRRRRHGASAVSSARVTTICGRTTPVVRGSSGRVKVSVSGRSSRLHRSSRGRPGAR